MRRGWLGLVVMVSACTHPPWGEEDRCDRDGDCDDGTVCSDVRFCTRADALRTLEVSWTVNGVIATPESPGRCTETNFFRIFVTDEDGGYEGLSGEQNPACTDGRIVLSRVPAVDVTIEGLAHANPYDPGDEPNPIVGETARTTVPESADAVTLDFQFD